MKKSGIFERKAWTMLSLIIISLAVTVTAYSAPRSIKNYDSEKSAVHEDSQLIWIGERDGCEHGLHRQPNGPMAILLFCEDALGDYIGLVYYDLMGAPYPIDFARGLSEEEKVDCYKKWSLGNRMWQESSWASDVTSYAWAPDGTKLYLTTSGIYGSGGLYELDLIRKDYREIVPSDQEANEGRCSPGYVITRIDNTEKRLFYKLLPWNSPKGENVIEHFVQLN